MIRFLHGADFHLDSAFGALPPGQAAARRRESRELALRLADYVKEHGIDLVLLAGDLFDSASPFRETGEQLAAALGQMRARVFISPGNHDWYGPGSPWETVDWPENVYVFKENRLTAVEVPERNLVIHGAAFSGPEQPESLLAGFTAPADGKCHIGLLHAKNEFKTDRRTNKFRQVGCHRNNFSATEIAGRCGFSSLSLLSRNFKQHFNITIREFRSQE